VSTHPFKRRAEALTIRIGAALSANKRPHPAHVSNGDEARYPNGIASFTKGLEHAPLTGEVSDPAQFKRLVKALNEEKFDRLDSLPPVAGVTRQRKFVNPQSGIAFDLEGPDAEAVTLPPAPRLDSAQLAGETVELYWMARLRDVAFSDYATDATAATAVSDLNALSDFRGPRDPATGEVTAGTLFRGSSASDLAGPYLSQFLLLDVPVSTLLCEQRQRPAMAGLDYMTTWATWLDVQNGEETSGTDTFDATRRYVRNGRDLATLVHFDRLYECYVSACQILLSGGAPFDAGNPYLQTARQSGFVTFGAAHIMALVGEATTRALKAMWYQKWFVHRLLRPEAYGGWVERNRTSPGSYPLHPDVTNSGGIAATVSATGSALLPQAFPEGSPLHPSYGAGHAIVAAACVSVLKAFFDESFPISQLRLAAEPGKPGPVLGVPRVPDVAGTVLVDYTGADAGQLTVGSELDKLAANVAVGRNHAGVHWFSDYVHAQRLGEEIAIDLLQEQRPTFHEQASFSLTRFDGSAITI
jgi:hypothetical protein